MKRFKHLITVLLVTSLAVAVSACGYHFPGSRAANVSSPLKNAQLVVTGPGVHASPMLANTLKDRVATRLGLETTPADGKDKLLLHMDAITHNQQLETDLGRAEQYRIQLRVQPVFQPAGDAEKSKTFPAVVSSTTYYDREEVTLNQSTRDQAEKTILNSMVDDLVILLSDI